jgi:hypothetical protein
MPSSLTWFFDNYSGVIDNYYIMPDEWRSEGLETGYGHYYDYDAIPPPSEINKSAGVLPWTVEDNFNTLVEYLKDNDLEHAAQLAGVIAHYIEDGSNPLHAEVNYSPGGNHTRYESRVDYQLTKDNVNADVQGFVPHKLDNVFNSTMGLLQDSFSNTPVLNFYLETNILWNDEIKTITENRLRTATELLADVWYTAFVQAGLATSPPTPQPSTNSRNYTPYAVGGVLAIAVIGIVITLYMRKH